tara:strand:+ start:397 stop:657 length:261 start_codon:yes stop_codon:yes gene_type:complete
MSNEIAFKSGVVMAHHSEEADNWVLQFHADNMTKMSALWKEFRQYSKEQGWTHTILIGRSAWMKDKTLIPYVVMACQIEGCTHCSG